MCLLSLLCLSCACVCCVCCLCVCDCCVLCVLLCVCVCVCLCVAGVGLVCWWCGVDFGRIAEKLWKECWQHWCKKMFGIKVFLTLLISTLTSNISFIQLSSFNCLQCFWPVWYFHVSKVCWGHEEFILSFTYRSFTYYMIKNAYHSILLTCYSSHCQKRRLFAI